MPLITTQAECRVCDSFRVQQVAGMFDVPLAERCSETFSVELPDQEEAWSIGAIIGPSGSGKTTIAKAAFGDSWYEPGRWPADKAVVDGFDDLSIKSITQTLTAVGFSSPPSWIKPYRVLSNGEQFRCDLARALLLEQPLVVFDEFTSVVDRTVAKIASAAVGKAIRRGRLNKRLVVVACHYDILEWLKPDWHVDMSTGSLTRGSLRRPSIELEIVRCRNEAWRLFSRHHYLSGTLPRASRSYMALWREHPVAYCAVAPLYGFAGRRRISRIVTLPDYQGVGIGSQFLDRVCGIERDIGHRMNITASHPAIIGYCRHSPHWRTISVSKAGSGGRHRVGKRIVNGSLMRSVVSFEYVGEDVTGL